MDFKKWNIVIAVLLVLVAYSLGRIKGSKQSAVDVFTQAGPTGDIAEGTFIFFIQHR